MKIPPAMIHFLAKVLPNEESRVTLKGLFESAGAPGDPPQGTKAEITRAWLKRINQVNSPDPLKTLGLILESLLDPTLDPQELGYEEQRDLRQRIDKFLARDDLEYRAGGQIVSTVAVGSPSRSLQEETMNPEQNSWQLWRYLMSISYASLCALLKK